jgi:hypothetical protein
MRPNNGFQPTSQPQGLRPSDMAAAEPGRQAANREVGNEITMAPSLARGDVDSWE